MKKKFVIEIEVEEEDYCFSDLKENIISGCENVGNHNVIDVYSKIDLKEEIIQISSHDLKKLLDNGCGYYTFHIMLDNDCEVSIERGDVDDMLLFD
jgi:hypothetical protein